LISHAGALSLHASDFAMALSSSARTDAPTINFDPQEMKHGLQQLPK
jgi:hypothetical protein